MCGRARILLEGGYCFSHQRRLSVYNSIGHYLRKYNSYNTCVYGAHWWFSYPVPKHAKRGQQSFCQLLHGWILTSDHFISPLSTTYAEALCGGQTNLITISSLFFVSCNKSIQLVGRLVKSETFLHTPFALLSSMHSNHNYSHQVCSTARMHYSMIALWL